MPVTNVGCGWSGGDQVFDRKNSTDSGRMQIKGPGLSVLGKVRSSTVALTFATADFGRTHVISSSEVITATLPAVSTVNVGMGYKVINASTAALVLTSASSENVQGSSSYSIATGLMVDIVQGITAWYVNSASTAVPT